MGRRGRQRTFDGKAARSRYDEGYNDCRIADELGMSVGRYGIGERRKVCYLTRKEVAHGGATNE